MKTIRIVNWVSILLAAFWTVSLSAQQAPPSDAVPAETKAAADKLSEQERSVREGKFNDALKKQQAAEALHKAHKDDEAIQAYEDALAILNSETMVPWGPKAGPLAHDISVQLADLYAEKADKLGDVMVNKPLADRNWDEPIKLAQKAVDYNPSDKHIRELLAALEREKVDPTILPPQRAVRPDQTPPRREERVMLADKLREARINAEAGYLEDAEKTLNEILLKDKYNIAALHYLKQVKDKEIEADALRYAVTNRKFVEDLDSKWWIRPPQAIKKPVLGTGGAPKSTRESTDEIRHRLNDIEIPEIDFKNADLQTVLDHLADQVRLLDPTHKGINLIINQHDNPEGRKIQSLKMHNTKLFQVLNTIADLVDMRFVVQPNAIVFVAKNSDYGRNFETRIYPVDPNFILKIVPTEAPAPVPGAGGGGGVGGGVAGGGPEGIGLAPSGTGIVAPSSEQIIAAFKTMGPDFPPGSSARYVQSMGRLIVTNTPENLEQIERLMADLNIGSNQVEIETKFLEIDESSLKELGFNWYLGNWSLLGGKYMANPTASNWPAVITPGATQQGGNWGGLPPPGLINSPAGSASVIAGGTTITGGGTLVTNGPSLFQGDPFNLTQSNALTGGLRDFSQLTVSAIDALLGGTSQSINDRVLSLAGVLTQPQFELVIRALAQSGKNDLLSAPRVTTTLGQQATIKIITEFIYPVRFNQPQAVAAAAGTTGGSAAVAVTPATPAAFQTSEIGVLLTATPIMGADGYTIILSLNPEVSEFLGFVDYGGIIQIPAAGTPQGFVSVQNKMPQPIFSKRSLITTVNIWDGQTVVLGGLARENIVEVSDKIPLLGDLPFIGRLFQSKGRSVSKSNLVIFVTATLIDPAGNRVHPEGSTGVWKPETPAVPKPDDLQPPPAP